MARTRQVNRLRALLLGGDDTDRDLSRGTLTTARLQAIARRRARIRYYRAVRAVR